jgi:hypothetical protein
MFNSLLAPQSSLDERLLYVHEHHGYNFCHLLRFHEFEPPSDPAAFRLEDNRRLREAGPLIDRLKGAVDRIVNTLSPQAVLDRLHVSADCEDITFDHMPFRVLPRSEGVYLFYLRLAAGEWVSSEEIIRDEKLSDFNVTRVLQSLEKNHRVLREIIDVNKSKGGRIVLPLPPAAIASQSK